MTQKELETLYLKTEHGIFTPNYTFETYNQETEEYTNLVIHQTAEEVYQLWLAQKDIPPAPTLEEEVAQLKASQSLQDSIIDDLVFEVIPTLESQIAITQPVTQVLVKMVNKGGIGMAAYLAQKIMDGKDYVRVFKTVSYKQYQDEVDTILELEGYGHLIKR